MLTTQRNHCILAIDLGTSGPKVAITAERGEVLGHEFENVELLLLKGGLAEQRPEEWWSAILKATHRLLDRGLVPVDEINAIACTTQWSGTVAIDSSGNPLANAIIWMDTRGSKYVEELTRGIINISGYGLTKLLSWIGRTGGIPCKSGKDSIAHILFLKNERPEIYEKTFKFLEPKDYLNFKLTGEVGASYDSIILHWVTDNRDISNIRYDDRLLGMTGLDREKLPDLHSCIEVLGGLRGEIAKELGLKPGIKVVMGMPDVQSAAIGSGAVNDFEPHLYVGTSSWLTCHVPFKRTSLFSNMASLPSGIPNRYLVVNEQETAGMCLKFLRNNILFHNDELGTGQAPEDYYQRLDRIAERTPAGSDRIIFTPWLFGERTPVEDHAVRGSFFNLSLNNTREHIIRSVFEGVAYNSRWLLDSLEAFTKRRMDPINFIGGGANSKIWCQIFADVFDRTIRQAKDPIEANIRGAAYQAAVALGELTFDDIPELTQYSNTFEPNGQNRAIYDELFGEFVNLYKQNRKIHKRLNRAH